MSDKKIQIENLRFPVGRFAPKDHYSEASRKADIDSLESLPGQLNEILSKLSTKQIDTPYREGGWTVRQLIHHIADSHMNSFIRFKLALTENNPVIKPYKQDDWVQMKESMEMPYEVSLKIIEGVHARLVKTIKDMSAEDFNRTLRHPEWKRDLTLDLMLALYGWHSRHHFAHITSLVEREG
ncbi:MAG: putative metal-dependent hydrolase [Bacteroidia bacterium]|nr:putative metal-dependent hydrolase [Bacteroidia bacterium]